MMPAPVPEPKLDITPALERWSVDVAIVQAGGMKLIERKNLKIAHINDGSHLLTRDDLGFELPQAALARGLSANPSEVWSLDNLTPISCRRDERHSSYRNRTPWVKNAIYQGRSVDVYITKINE